MFPAFVYVMLFDKVEGNVTAEAPEGLVYGPQAHV